jgi:hypothetical protein
VTGVEQGTGGIAGEVGATAAVPHHLLTPRRLQQQAQEQQVMVEEVQQQGLLLAAGLLGGGVGRARRLAEEIGVRTMPAIGEAPMPAAIAAAEAGALQDGAALAAGAAPGMDHSSSPGRHQQPHSDLTGNGVA